MKFVLMMLTFLVPCLCGFARQQSVQWDTAAIHPRSFDASAIRSLKQQKAFQYKNLQESSPSLWDRFWTWFWWKVDQILSTPGGKNTMWTLFVIFGASMIVFFVMKVTGMNKAGLFGRSSRGAITYTASPDDIYAIPFDQAIQEAVASGNYRLAVRLLYLQTLKKLADEGFIEWQLNKTNTDYVSEVSKYKWKPVFEKLTQSFEYTWYGEVTIAVEHYQALQQQFQQFNFQLQ